MNTVIKKTLLLLSFTGVTIQSFAQEGRWQSLEENSSSSPTGFLAIVILLIGLALGGFFIKLMLESDEHSNNDKGCIVIFIVGIILLGIIAAAASV